MMYSYYVSDVNSAGYALCGDSFYAKSMITSEINKAIKDGKITPEMNLTIYMDSKGSYYNFALMKNKNGAKAKLGYVNHDLGRYIVDDADFSRSIRTVRKNEEKGVMDFVIYMWRRKDLRNSDGHGYSYPFHTKESVYFELSNGTPIHGKITNVVDMYGGDCIALYISSDKKSFENYNENPLYK